MILEQIETKVVATMRANGMRGLDELAPTEDSLKDIKFKVTKLEVRSAASWQRLSHLAPVQATRSPILVHLEC